VSYAAGSAVQQLILFFFFNGVAACHQVSYAAGSAVVRLFSRVDRWLEQRRFFSALLPQALPKEVFDTKTGGMTKQCKQVRRHKDLTPLGAYSSSRLGRVVHAWVLKPWTAAHTAAADSQCKQVRGHAS
jgi:hypothetical protein